MKKEDSKMLITFDDIPEQERWDACIKLMKSEYNMTFKEMCRILMCSRSWAVRYLKPHLHYIYISNGAGKSANFLRIANNLLDEEYSESTFYSRKEFASVITSFITDTTRQTIRIPIERLIEEKYHKEFFDNYITMDEIYEKIDKRISDRELMKIYQLRNKLVEKYAVKNGYKAYADSPSKYKRTDTEHCKIDLKSIDLMNLKAVHDEKDYGDTDEEIYRQLFENGCTRLVMRIPDDKGNTSERVYYLDNQDFNYNTSKEVVLIKYSNFVRL